MTQKAIHVGLILETLVTQTRSLLPKIRITEPIGENNVPANIVIAEALASRSENPDMAIIVGSDLQNLGSITPAQRITKRDRPLSFFAPFVQFGPIPAMTALEVSSSKMEAPCLAIFGPRL